MPWIWMVVLEYFSSLNILDMELVNVAEAIDVYTLLHHSETYQNDSPFSLSQQPASLVKFLVGETEYRSPR